MIIFYQILFLISTYLVTSIPFGLVLAKLFHKQDIREAGSKNIGATNATRVLGKKFGFITLILDGGKGASMIILANNFFVSIPYLNYFLALVAVISIIGHIFPIYLKFKGGKGVATGMAVLLTINPLVGLIFLIFWIITFSFTKVSALSSLLSITITTVFVLCYPLAIEEVMLTIFLAFLMFFRHKENINRILKSKEYKTLKNTSSK
jgi:glycerol-3-phosphate acyltransferase PlsY